MASATTTIGKYLIRRLEEAGLRHVFGIPGDYVLRFYDLLEESKMKVIGTCTEAGAGFAADAYARVNGLGAVCVTYCVGGFNALNAIAGAYAEKSPVVLISGAPGMGERARSPLLHHKVRDYDTQRLIFEKVTVAAEALEDPRTAPQQIDDTLMQCLRQKRPVYLEIPRDMVDAPCRVPIGPRPRPPRSDARALAESIAEAAAMLRAARRPVILGGVEIHRFGLQNELLKLAKRTGYPIAAMLLSKSILSEQHPQYVGVYEGAMGRDSVRRVVESADVVLILGAFLTDIDVGTHTTRLDQARTVNANAEGITIRHHHFDRVRLSDFMAGLATSNLGPRRQPTAAMREHARQKVEPYRARPRHAITVRRFFDRMNEFLGEETMVICDIGDSLFGAADLTIHRRTEFLSPAYYTSMGFALPAAVGAQIRRRKPRPVVFVGDGAFQMTGMELSTVARYGLNPIVFVLNNRGYTTERFIQDGPYNDVHEWAYHRVPEVLGAGWGQEVRTEGDLEQALTRALANNKTFSIINVLLDPWDHSRAMERLARRLGSRVRSASR